MTVARRGFLAVLVGLLLGLQGCDPRAPDVIRVGSKAFSEGALLGYIQLLLLERAGLRVEDRIEMGPTLILRQALRSGEIDTYIEYTGTALVNFFKLADPALLADATRGWEEARSRDATDGLVWLKPWALNNTYTVLMSAEKAAAWGVRTVSDLARHRSLRFGSDPEFAARADGLPGLLKIYGVSAEIKQLNAGLIYQALRDDHLDAGIGYSTDGRIPAFGLMRLADDRRYFPAYHPAPVFRAATLERFGRIRETLDAVAAKVTDDAITALNYEMDVNRGRAKDLARGFLDMHHLIDPITRVN
ncbi:MAG: hypothetical protein FJZ01_07655 [Candidatus Sericytochromatia bacterium]|nr:hypothetical protein [Candidatus Tanganyikabacteria bacterium]